MQSESIIVAVVALLAVTILLFLIRKNRSDRKEVENKLNQDYRKHKKSENDVETEGRDSI